MGHGERCGRAARLQQRGPSKGRRQRNCPRDDRRRDGAGRRTGGVGDARATLRPQVEDDRQARQRIARLVVQIGGERHRIVVIAAAGTREGEPGGDGVRTGEAQHIVEEGALGVGVDRPVDRR